MDFLKIFKTAVYEDVQFFQFNHFSPIYTSINICLPLEIYSINRHFLKIVVSHLQEEFSFNILHVFLERIRLAYALVAAGQLFFVSSLADCLAEGNGLARSPS